MNWCVRYRISGSDELETEIVNDCDSKYLAIEIVRVHDHRFLEVCDCYEVD